MGGVVVAAVGVSWWLAAAPLSQPLVFLCVAALGFILMLAGLVLCFTPWLVFDQEQHALLARGHLMEGQSRVRCWLEPSCIPAGSVAQVHCLEHSGRAAPPARSLFCHHYVIAWTKTNGPLVLAHGLSKAVTHRIAEEISHLCAAPLIERIETGSSHRSVGLQRRDLPPAQAEE